MSKKVKICIATVIILLGGGLLYDAFGQSIKTNVSEVLESEEKKQSNKPKIEFIPNPSYTVCTNNEELEWYENVYMMIVSSCVDMNGKNIRDEDHITWTTIDWTKEGTQTVSYTVTDDYGRKITKSVDVMLTEPIDTGH